MIYSLKSHKLPMIDFVLKFCIIYFSLKNKNHFKDLLPFYCEKKRWYYSLLKELTSLCRKKKNQKNLTTYAGSSAHGKYPKCHIGHALLLMFVSTPCLSGLGKG